MHRIVVALFVLGVGLGLTLFGAAEQNSYKKSLKPKGFTAHAVVLPPRTIGKTVIRDQTALAVEIRIQVEDYLPRDMEPKLMIDGVPVNGASRVIGVEDGITTLGFLVEKPNLLKEGATLEVQMGDEVETRSRVPGVLQREKILPLDKEETQRWELPPLDKWLLQTKPSPD